MPMSEMEHGSTSGDALALCRAKRTGARPRRSFPHAVGRLFELLASLVLAYDVRALLLTPFITSALSTQFRF